MACTLHLALMGPRPLMWGVAFTACVVSSFPRLCDHRARALCSTSVPSRFLSCVLVGTHRPRRVAPFKTRRSKITGSGRAFGQGPHVILAGNLCGCSCQAGVEKKARKGPLQALL